MRKILLFFCLAMGLFALQNDKDMLNGELKNGLKYYIKENKFPQKTAIFYLVINSGSTDERDGEQGLAHFLEHMAFNGSRDFSKNELIKQLESLGVKFGADLNAQTSYDQTSYILTINVNEKNLQDTFKVFSNWIDGVKIDPKELDKERGVIMEEERQRNTPGYRLYLAQTKDIFEGSIYLKRVPIGDMNVIKSVDAKHMQEFYERLYQPRFMSFVAVGDFDKNEIKSLIEKSFSQAKNTNSYIHPEKNISFKNGLNIFNYDSNETGMELVRLSYFDKFSPVLNEADAKRNLEDALIASLINMLYEQKNANNSSNLSTDFIAQTLQAKQKIYSFETNVLGGDFNASLKDMLGVIKGIKEFGFNKDDFTDVKKAFVANIDAKFKRSKTKKSSAYTGQILNMIENGGFVLSDEDDKELSLKLLNEITLADVNDRFRQILAISDERVRIFSKDGFKLSKDEFLKLFAKTPAYNTNLSASNNDKSLGNENLEPKEISSRSFDEKNEIYTYKMQNGSQVIFKPLATKKDSILFAAVSKGGISNLADPKLGSFAVALTNESGVGKFNNYELSKALNGKIVSYEKGIEALTQGIYGSSSTSDLSSLLAIINLEFNSPRADAHVLERIKQRAKDELSKEQNLPEYKFSTEFSKFFYENNKRVTPLEMADIDALKLNELKAIIKDKFTNAASYTFVIIGDTDEERLLPLVKKYIATLPKLDETEEFKDDGVRSIKGQHTFKREYQSTKRSDVGINIINSDAKYSFEGAIKLRALSEILKTALREKIREDKGQTYGFSLNAKLSRYPFEHSDILISFTCDPANTDKIIAEIKQIIASIKRSGAILPKHLEDFKAQSEISIKKDYEKPEFWQKLIISNKIFNTPLYTADEYISAVKAITNDNIKEAAKLYLDEKNMVISINNPK
ncbi:M16 family metallopeptidase [Campylobacter concisus]|uniref:M16 family metallopeptidase n=1 Tax=Campylobacter concisus TaxID=199 RepID=UPI000CD8AA04|nr:M16 family metallopeptidase [Campylobacter concisus]